MLWTVNPLTSAPPLLSEISLPSVQVHHRVLHSPASYNHFYIFTTCAWCKGKRITTFQKLIACSQISWHGQFCAAEDTWVYTFRSVFFVALSASWSFARRQWGMGRRAQRCLSQNWRRCAAKIQGKTGKWRPAGPVAVPHHSERKQKRGGEEHRVLFICTRST